MHSNSTENPETSVPDTAEQPRPTVALLADPAHIPVFLPGPRDALWRWGAIFAVFALYVVGAGSFGLWDPWETHYGEVSRHMVETFDWVNPWWGYAQKIGSEPLAGEWFYSKPIYIFWAECTFIKLIGLSDWAFRLPIALLGASIAATAYLVVERIATRAHALMVLIVVALSPFVYMVSRQAQTDMPYVATMALALLLFALALFGKRQPLTDRGFGWATAGFTAFVLANLVPQLSIIATDLTDPNADAGKRGLEALGAVVQQNGVYHLIFYVPVALAVLVSVLLPIWRQRKHPDGFTDAFKDRQLRRFYLLSGYMLAAQATYAKGLLGFMLPGAILVVYLIVSAQWRIVGRLDLLRGIPLFFVTVLPWYVAMFCRHGMPYYQRFFIHDHFNRVGAGVHQIDTGTFEYFVEWLGYGLFPWAAFAPLALLAAARHLRVDRQPAPQPGEPAVDRGLDHFKAFVFVWFLLSFFLFTLSSTRFHHYILPGVPAVAMLTGLYLLDLLRDNRRQARLAIVVAFALLIAIAFNLGNDYQNLRELFTYKYDRPLPDNLPIVWQAPMVWSSDTHPIVTWAETPFARHVGPMVAQILSWSWLRYEIFVPFIASLAGLGVLVMAWRRVRLWGLALLTLSAAVLALWTLDYYMPSLAPHWSQKYVFEAYYEDCTLHPNPPLIEEAFTPLVSKVGLGFVADFFDAKPKRVCKEDIISWLITWRGETFYSNNEIRPLNKATQFVPYLKEMNKGRTFYALLERGRTSGFASKLRAESRKLRDEGSGGFGGIKDWNVDLVGNDSAYFVIARAVPVLDGSPGAAKPDRRLGTQAPRSSEPPPREEKITPGQPGAMQ
jgi:4-amino-4-deoxy-L-arabinose transferase-like glycosyltransferase